MKYVVNIASAITKRKVTLIATASNNYNSRIYVPAGEYEISECGILNDSANEYPMIKPADFTVAANDFHLIESTLSNYEEIESEASRRMTGVKEEAPKTDTLKATTKEESSSILPWRTFKHSGKGPDIILTGTSITESDIVVKITKSGTSKVGEFQYSTDNGQSCK